MDTATRIYTIDRASAGLVQYEKHRLQMILRNFGLQTYDWEGSAYGPESPKEYVIGRLEGMSDPVLEEIDAFVAADLGHIPAPRTPAKRKPWTECPSGVFLSHKFEDAEFASRLSSGLKMYGIEGFVAHKDISVSAQWRASIMEGLDTCDAFVAIMHESFHDSQWCDQEVGWALGRHIPVMVVRPTSLTGPRNDGFIEQFQDLPVDRSSASCTDFTVGQIYKFLAARPELRDQIAESLVWALEHPRSHPHVIATYRAMTALDFTWTDPLLRRVKIAEETNGFVRDAFTIPHPIFPSLQGYEASTLHNEVSGTDEPPF